jgi:hypothetical protein
LFSNGSTIAQDNANFFWDDTNNRLGIGNATPSHPLDVTGIIKGSTSIYATNDLFVGDTTGSATGRLIITDSSNQGINIRRNNAVSERFKLFVGNGTTYTQDNAIILGVNTDIDFYTGASPVRTMTISNNNRVGIGTNVPSGKLHLSTTSDTYLVMTGGASPRTYSFLVDANNLRLFSGVGGTTLLTIASTGAATFSSSIAATSAAFSSTATATSFIPSGASTPSNGVFLPAANSLGFATNSVNYMRLNSTGNLIIINPGDVGYTNTIKLGDYRDYTSGGGVYIAGSTNPSAGTASIELGTNQGSSINCNSGAGRTVSLYSLSGSGTVNVQANNSGTLIISSDSSLKQEDTNHKVEGLAEILKLIPRAYKWLDDIEERGEEAATELGFFADEVNPIIPSAAPKNINTNLYGFNDRAITAALVKAIQELQEQINELKNK